ncbi:MAG: ferritin family protein [Candidatus Omnitrophota bacterium]
MTPEEMVYKAIEMEEKGREFYKDAAKQSKNVMTKRTFEYLAQDEIFHIENLKKYYTAMREKSALPDFSLEKAREKRGSDFTIFSEKVAALNEKEKEAATDKKAYEFAMDFENSGYKYYESMLAEAKEETIAGLLKFLLQEETRHHDLLQSTYTFLTDPENWFMREEGGFPQG